MRGAHPPALALYVHTPWCVRKCPYCDFNSHEASGEPPFDPYVERLLADLDQELSSPAARRPLASIFIGGGTPSLVPGGSIASLLEGVRARADLTPGCEVTLEANPGVADAGRFAQYREGGVNRLSIGVQSLSEHQLRRLGRIHDPAAARAAVGAARAAGFDNLNLDLMFGLPGQTLGQARDDLEALIALAPEHISYYQLTLEPNTAFHAAPPELPDADLVADMAVQGRELLAQAGYRQYEVSAHARPGRCCRHNLNYWRFGDYLGIGAGAHGKLTDPANGRVRRRAKLRHPVAYLQAPLGAATSREWMLDPPDLVFEFALNAFRLTGGFETSLFTRATGLPWARLRGPLLAAQGEGLLQLRGGRVEPTALGRDFLDTLVSRFLPDPSGPRRGKGAEA
ncbi:MAG: radical SAM family heme chaperone HemW [Bdellovibrio bacteriovorus]